MTNREKLRNLSDELHDLLEDELADHTDDAMYDRDSVLKEALETWYNLEA